MAAEEKSAARGTVATVVATASVTLAIGVTLAALGGYLVPAGNKPQPAEVTEPTVAPPLAAASPSAPNVVLVPIAPDSARAPDTTAPAQPAPEVLLANYERTGDHDRDDDDDHSPHGREHREREHEDGHDDD